MQQRRLVKAVDASPILQKSGLILTGRTSDGREGEVSDGTAIVFRLGVTCYSISSHFVHGIQPLGRYTPLPFTQPCIVGIAEVQGHQIAIVDIRPLHAQTRTTPLADAVVILVYINEAEVGLLADRVLVMPPVVVR